MMNDSFDLVSLLKNYSKNPKHNHKPTSILSVSNGVLKRVEVIKHLRKSNRLSAFDCIRNLPTDEIPSSKFEQRNKSNYKKLQLEKWKAEKESKKRAAEAKKKKPFVTGIPHAPLSYAALPPFKPITTISQRVTRSQTALKTKANVDKSQNYTKQSKSEALKSFAPNNAAFKPPKLTTTEELPVLAPLKQTKKKVKAHIIFEPVVPKSKNGNNNLTPRNKVPKSESRSEEKLRSPQSCQDVPSSDLMNDKQNSKQVIAEANGASPYVTFSRGKDNARKEMKEKINEGILDEDASNIDNVDHFRHQLQSEVKRITEMCATWEKISQQVPLSESAQELVLGAVGQARLLVSQKLAQFGSLVETCARPEPGAALVTPADLHGFWDMVFMQVDNVDLRFKKLEDLRARNWVEEVSVVEKKKAIKVIKSKARTGATSRLRDVIAAARKAKKENPTPTEDSLSTEADVKTFEAGFFCVQSPVKFTLTPVTPSTPINKPNLLKSVLSSEAKKASASKNCASLAMLRASIIGRSLESSEDSLEQPKTPTTPVCTMATPARSILKTNNKVSTRKSSHKKSIKVVLFHNSDTEHEENNTTMNRTEYNKLQKEIDIGITALSLKKHDKENQGRQTRSIGHSTNEERSPVMTRSRRKSMNTPLP